MKINHKLMNNNFTSGDINAVKKFLKNKNVILTQSKKVEEFEKNGQNGLELNILLLLTQDLLRIIFQLQF